MKGIILAGGKGTRLYPLTLGLSKQILPVYDKPMIYYPLSTLMVAGIRDILLISSAEALPLYQQMLGNGSQWGISLRYVTQREPRGLPEAFILGEDFIGKDPVCLILGDNLFYGFSLANRLEHYTHLKEGAAIFGYAVRDPENYGVLAFDANGNVQGIEEKPKQPKSNYAIPGLYFYDNQVSGFSKNLRPSARGELEISDLNREYLRRGQLKVELLGRGTAWLDTGTHDSLLQAANFIQTVEARQGLKIGAPEEVAFRRNYISKSQLEKLAGELKSTEYGAYLSKIAHETFA